MRNCERLASAKQRAVSALEPSRDGAADAAATQLLAAELTLIRGGREDLGHRLAAARDGDVTGSDCRTEIRQVVQLIDAELEPSVTTDSFVAASDGGER